MNKPHKLAVARVEAGFMSQKVFAEACEISTTQIANYERGWVDKPTINSLGRIAKALEISINEANKLFK